MEGIELIQYGSWWRNVKGYWSSLKGEEFLYSLTDWLLSAPRILTGWLVSQLIGYRGIEEAYCPRLLLGLVQYSLWSKHFVASFSFEA